MPTAKTTTRRKPAQKSLKAQFKTQTGETLVNSMACANELAITTRVILTAIRREVEDF